MAISIEIDPYTINQIIKELQKDFQRDDFQHKMEYIQYCTTILQRITNISLTNKPILKTLAEIQRDIKNLQELVI